MAAPAGAVKPCAGVDTDSVAAVQQIEDLQCPVCTEMAVAAVRMPCGHSCDAACLQHWFMNSIRTVRKLRCPVCRAEPTEVEEAVELRQLVEARIASDPSLEPDDRQACVIVHALLDTMCYSIKSHTVLCLSEFNHTNRIIRIRSIIDVNTGQVCTARHATAAGAT